MGHEFLRVNLEYPQKRHIDRMVEALKDDGLIIYPTDTTYGLGGSLFSKKAIEKIYMLKPHKKKKPLTFLCSDLKDISRYAHVPDLAYRVMKRLIPGPYTFILEATREVPKLVMTNRKTVGIRVPDNNICLQLVEGLGNPIISTTAVSAQKEYFDDPYDLRDRLGHAVDYIVDGGLLAFDPSTVIDLTDPDGVKIIREGKGDISNVI